MVYEEVVSYLNERLDLGEFLSPLQIEKFYLIIAKYLTNRTTLETFKANFEDTLDFYTNNEKDKKYNANSCDSYNCMFKY